MKELFKFLVFSNELGELQKANYYDEDFATLEFKKDGKIYSVSLRCEEVTDGNR
jgi:hypothetical protein